MVTISRSFKETFSLSGNGTHLGVYNANGVAPGFSQIWYASTSFPRPSNTFLMRSLIWDGLNGVGAVVSSSLVARLRVLMAVSPSRLDLSRLTTNSCWLMIFVAGELCMALTYHLQWLSRWTTKDLLRGAKWWSFWQHPVGILRKLL